MATRRVSITDLRMEMVARAAAGAALIVVAASFAYSFAQIKWVSDQLGTSPAWLSYAFPFIIDLPALVASALTVALHDRGFRQRAYAWSVLVTFTGLSWVCNAVHATSHSTIVSRAGGAGWAYLLVAIIAGFPPIGVVLGCHLWAFSLRNSARADLPAVRAPAMQPAPASTRTAAPAVTRSTPHTAASDDAPDVRGRTGQQEARALFDRAVAADPWTKPDAAAIGARAQVDAHAGTVRRWVQAWWAEHQADLGERAPGSDEDLTMQAATPRRGAHAARTEQAEHVA